MVAGYRIGVLIAERDNVKLEFDTPIRFRAIRWGGKRALTWCTNINKRVSNGSPFTRTFRVCIFRLSKYLLVFITNPR